MSEYSNFIGLDLSDRTARFCVLDGAGDEVATGSVVLNGDAFERAFGGYDNAVVALEAGTGSAWVSRTLAAQGHGVVVANARKLGMIYMNERKSDVRDAEILARFVRMDPKLLHPVTHRGERAQADLSCVRSRDLLVRTRSSMISNVRSMVKSFGHRLPPCSTPYFASRVKAHIPVVLEAALLPMLEIIAGLTQQIKDFERLLEKKCREAYPETELLLQVPGVGPITALTFVLSLEHAERFEDSRDVGAFLGLVPRRDQSGNMERQLRITKAGDGYLRKLLVGCAQHILGHFGQDSALRQWGLKLAERGGGNGKKRAVVAVARKLAVLLHHLWANGIVYEAFPNRRY